MSMGFARRPLIALVLWFAAAAALLAGCADGATLRFTSLDEEDAYVGGEEVVTTFELDGGDVLRSELFLDGVHVASGIQEEYELRWSTLQFTEGSHRLKVRAYTGVEDYLEKEIPVTVDNTRPELGALPTTGLIAGNPVEMMASDNLGVDRLELVAPLPGPPVIAKRLGEELPFVFLWPGPCGDFAVKVRAIDRAGWITERTFQVESQDQSDRDCDGHRADHVARGDDCNDNASWARPGAPEPPEGLDLNCDGQVSSLPGHDTDGDGVLSFSDGGEDCDDTDPEVHGGKRAYASQPVLADGLPVTWRPGEAVLVHTGYSTIWELIINRNGTIQQVRSNILTGTQVRTLATDANPGSVAANDSHVAYGRGNDVVVLRNEGAEWVERAVIPSDAPISRLTLNRGYKESEEQLYLAFQAGTRVWRANARPDGLAWTQRLLVDAHAPLTANPSVWTIGHVAFHTATAAWLHQPGYEGGTPPSTYQITTAGELPGAVLAYESHAILATSVGQNTHVKLHHGFVALEAAVHPGIRVKAMWVQGQHVFMQLDGGSLQIVDRTRGFRPSQPPIAELSFDTATYEMFAGDGRIYTPDFSGSIAEALDAPDDAFDANCNGIDG